MSERTPMHPWHRSQNARMADFGGYEMPLWYSSAREEHMCVLNAAGLFDTSHMAVVWVSGPQALELLQECFTRDLAACQGPSRSGLTAGRCTYGAFLDAHGSVIDDAIVYRMADERFMVVVNAGMGPAVAGHLTDRAGRRRAAVGDGTGRVAKIDLQGPAAGRILQPLLSDPDAAWAGMVYFSFKGDLTSASGAADSPLRLADGTPVLLSRTGYTGEFGFEIFLPPEKAPAVWEAILASGEHSGLLPCGLAARDSLRGGAGLPLSHQDIGPWPFIRHPWEFALPWNRERTGFTKTFVGARRLLEPPATGHTVAFIGNDLRKVTVSDPAEVLDAAGAVIGTVLTCVTDMGIGRQNGRVYSVASPDKPEGFVPRGLCCGFIRTDAPLVAGTVVSLRDRRRTLPVTVVDTVRPDLSARRPLGEFI